MLTAAAMMVSAPSMAETVYIRDTLYVPLRGGQSSEHRILHRGLRSGTPLELLQTNDDTGYSLVRLEDGREGWLQTQYLVDEPIAEDQLAGVEARLLELEGEHQRSLLRVQELQDENASLVDELEALRAEYDQTSAALEEITRLSENTLNIQEMNDSLQAEREALNQQIDALLMANDELLNDSAQEWFLRGGAVVIIALVLGFWFARRIYQRNNSTWS